MRIKKVRGYIASREIDGVIVPHKVQNLIIREFCQNNNLFFLLSSVEYKMENSYFILNSILEELIKIDGIVMYSFFQITRDSSKRKKFFKKILKKKKFICFALENIIIKNETDLKKFEEIYSINNLLKFCPQKV